MRAGMLTELATFFRTESQVSETGSARKTKVKLCDRHCQRDKQADRLMMTGIQEFRGGTVVLTLRYDAQLQEATEFEYEGSRYKIVGFVRRRTDQSVSITGTRLDTR